MWVDFPAFGCYCYDMADNSGFVPVDFSSSTERKPILGLRLAEPRENPLSDEYAPEFLESERLARGEDVRTAAQRVFEENVLGAAASIVKMALQAHNERIRLQAAQYVVERAMGRVQDNPPARPDNPFDNLMARVVTEIDPEVVRQELIAEKARRELEAGK